MHFFRSMTKPYVGTRVEILFRSAPLQAGEPREITVERDPRAPVLYGEGGIVRVGDQWPRCPRIGDQLLEELPVAWPRRDDHRACTKTYQVLINMCRW